MTAAVAESKEADANTKQASVETLQALLDQALRAKEKRDPTIVRALLLSLGATISKVAATSIWSQFGPQIMSFLAADVMTLRGLSRRPFASPFGRAGTGSNRQVVAIQLSALNAFQPFTPRGMDSRSNRKTPVVGKAGPIRSLPMEVGLDLGECLYQLRATLTAQVCVGDF